MSFDNKMVETNWKTTNEESLASQYALQVALQTMKERCQQLQTRLSMVEDENLLLKIEKQKLLQCDNPQNDQRDIDEFQEQVVHLSRQKSQLTHHIQMVATENKNLWTRLSLLTESNDSIGTRISRISNALATQTPNKLSQFEMDTAGSELAYVKDFDFPNNGENLNFEGLEFKSDEDYEHAVQDLNYFKHRLNYFLNIIKDQQNVLKYVTEKLVLYNTGAALCAICNSVNVSYNNQTKTYNDATTLTDTQISENDSESEEIQKILRSDQMYSSAHSNLDYIESDRICPICGKTYYSTDLNIFVNHVQEHFEEDEDRFQSDSLLYDGNTSVK